MRIQSLLSSFQLDLIAPPSGSAGDDQLLSQIQTFRGRIYLQDGAIPESSIDATGRHRTRLDETSFHFVLRNSADEIKACFRLRLMQPRGGPEEFELQKSVLRSPADQRLHYISALDQICFEAQQDRLLIGEAGGWASDKEIRNTLAPILLPLSGWALCAIRGHAHIVAIATKRHVSADLLMRIGALRVRFGKTEAAPYFDSYFGCEMELLHFDSRIPDSKYVVLINQLKDYFVSRYGDNLLSAHSFIESRRANISLVPPSDASR